MSHFGIGEDLKQARDARKPVVLLDAMLLTYGLSFPANLDAALNLKAEVAGRGAVPLFAAMLAGRIVLGLSSGQLRELAGNKTLAKIGPADLAVAAARKTTGLLTVGSLLVVARQSGIEAIGTGGLGGLHRGLPEVVDISSDLAELSRSPVAVVCSGAKAILDLPNTVELLETLGVPVLGFGVDHFPGYWTRETGLPVTARVDTVAEAAAVFRAQRELALPQGLLFTNPIEASMGLESSQLEQWIEAAQALAREKGIRGKALTPFLQKRLQDLSAGETIERTLRLLTDNSLLAADLALALGPSISA
jgi:pseudouridine-5'-phosphate glycosidase